jgi:hypothetical protein
MFMASGCSLNTFLPANRFDYPETYGKWLWGRTKVSYQGTTRVELVPNYTAIPPSVTQPKLVSDDTILNEMSISGDGGIIKNLDLFLKLPMTSAPSLLGVKYQIWGHSYEDRKKGDFAGAVTLGGGFNRHDVNLESDGVPANVKDQTWALDLGFVGGYRFTQDLMLYGGPFFANYNTTGTISQPGRTYDFTGTGTQLGFNTGVFYSFQHGLGAALEFVIVDLKWSYAQSLTKNYIGATVSQEF